MGKGEGSIAYQPDAHPRLGEVDKQVILRPPPRGRDLLQREVIPVLCEVNLHNQRDSLDCIRSAQARATP